MTPRCGGATTPGSGGATMLGCGRAKPGGGPAWGTTKVRVPPGRAPGRKAGCPLPPGGRAPAGGLAPPGCCGLLPCATASVGVRSDNSAAMTTLRSNMHVLFSFDRTPCKRPANASNAAKANLAVMISVRNLEAIHGSCGKPDCFPADCRRRRDVVCRPGKGRYSIVSTTSPVVTFTRRRSGPYRTHWKPGCGGSRPSAAQSA
jgi:hypothetical protein